MRWRSEIAGEKNRTVPELAGRSPLHLDRVHSHSGNKRNLRSTLDEQLEAHNCWEEVQGVLSQPFCAGGPTKDA